MKKNLIELAKANVLKQKAAVAIPRYDSHQKLHGNIRIWLFVYQAVLITKIHDNVI